MNICLVLAATLFHSGNAFTGQAQLANTRTPSTELYGKRARAMKKVKKILGKDEEVVEEAVAAVAPKPVAAGNKVKLSSGRAKDLAKKYEKIDDLGERAFQVLLDLNMVGR